MNPRKDYEIGKEYGWLTVLREAEKDQHGHRRFEVECRCGKRYLVLTGFLGKKEPKCWECSHAYDMANRREPRIGSSINGWRIIDCVTRYRDKYIYECQCENCGHISFKDAGEIGKSKSSKCSYCAPDYKFKITDNCATGTLLHGGLFLVDADMVTDVSQKRWYKDSKGYIVSKDGGEKIFLHRFVLGYSNADEVLVDHVNRNTTDCRRNNLRLVTAQQNAMNRSIGKNNTSGYVGVCYDKRGEKYIARIGLNNHYYFLGSSVNPIKCAQMYNYASQALFRQFAGHQNDVPPISEALRRKVEIKIAPLLRAADIATSSL